MTQHPTRPELVGHFGMVAATHWLAAATGMSVLERGGNAFDAAVAAGFVMQVVEPHLSGPAGEVPIVLWSERDQAARVVCGQGVAPAAASTEVFRGLGLDTVPGTGLLAATVPGAFGGWMLLLQQWGTWRVRDVLDYAIGFARRGFPVVPTLHDAIAAVTQLFTTDWNPSAAQWLDRGAAPATGSRWTLPALADTYERLVREAEAAGDDRDAQIDAARRAFYEGFVADAIHSFADTAWLDSSGRAHTGLLRGSDLAAWRAHDEAPATFDFGAYRVCKTGIWGQGPVFLQQLALLDAAGIRDVEHGSADYLHLVVEASKLAFADREAWYGDSGVIDDPLATLLSPAYNAERAALIGETASRALRPGSIDGHAPHIPAVAGTGGAAGIGEPTLGSAGRVRGDTCHVDVADRFGNLVSATPSGAWLQSSPTIPELGFCLGTRAQMFWLEDGHPNSLRPGVRPRTTLTPSLAFRDGRPWMAFGTPGGDQQDQWSLALFLGVVLGGKNLQDAIDAPAFTSEHWPSSFYPRASRPGFVRMESRFPIEIVNSLRARGHEIELSGPWSLGRLSAVARDADATLRAGANPRGAQGYAVGR